MSLKTHFLFWVFTLCLCGLFLWAFQGILMPFVIAFAVAYLLNPLIEKLCALGLPRMGSICVILIGFLSIVGLSVAAIFPIFYHEFVLLIHHIPGYVDQILDWLQPHIDSVQALIAGEEFDDMKGEMIDLKSMLGISIQGGIKGGSAVVSTGVNFITGSSQAIGAFLSAVLFIPVISFIMMEEWPKLQSWCKDLIPPANRKIVMSLIKEIDQKISGFVRGQITVALVMAAIYAVALMLAGLQYGLLIGIVSGLLGVIPMLGSVLGLVIGVGVAWLQTGGDWSFIALIGGIFVVGQILEGNVLTPKLVGDSVGLHPVWIFFAVLAGGALLGITGMFLAVPVVAVAGVLIGFAIKSYKNSPFYKDQTPDKTQAKAKIPAKKKTATTAKKKKGTKSS